MLARLLPPPTTAAGALSRGPAAARAVRSLSSALGVPLPVAPAAEVKPGRTAQAFYRNLPVSQKKLRVVANLTPKLYWREVMMQLEFCRTPGAGDARPLAPPPPPLRCAATPEAAEPLTPLLCFGSISLGVDAPAPCEMPYLELPPLPSLEPLAAKGKKGWRTYQPNVLKRKRTHGFLHRMSTRAGRNTLSRRRRKGRWQIAVT